MTTLHSPSTSSVRSTHPAGRARGRSLGLLTGAGFVASALVGNSLTESVAGDGVLGDLAAQAASTAARAGLALELVGFALLIAFVSALGARVLPGRATAAAVTVVVAGGVAAAVKLGSGAVLLAALHDHAALDEVTARALVASNNAAFVLFWLPLGVFVAAAARALADHGDLGRVGTAVGVGAGVLTAAAGVAGSVDPDAAVPVPFLVGLLWVAVVSARLALRRPVPVAG